MSYKKFLIKSLFLHIITKKSPKKPMFMGYRESECTTIYILEECLINISGVEKYVTNIS